MNSKVATSATPQQAYQANKPLGFLAMFLSATGMGMVAFFSRNATAGLDDSVSQYLGSFLAMGRMTVGLIGFLLILVFTRRWQAFRESRLSFTVIAGGVSIGTSLALYITATLLTSSTNAVFLIYTGPLFATILARIFRKEPISRSNAIFLLLVFIGMIFTIELIKSGEHGLVFDFDLAPDTVYPQKPLGNLIALLSGVFYGLALFFYGYRQDMDSDVRGTWNFFWALIATGIITLFIRPDITTMDGGNWGYAFGLFFVSGFIALGLIVVAGRNLPAVEMSCISYWECLVALIVGLALLEDTMTIPALLGGVLIMIGGIGPIIVEWISKDKAETETVSA